MSKLSDADLDYLRTIQYRSAHNLDARIALHRRYSTSPTSWHTWIFNAILTHTPGSARVLEVGAGTGTLWQQNRARIPAAWRITVSDFSSGLVAGLQATLLDPRFTCLRADVQELPFRNGRFDTAIANHMLYHVPRRASAIAELRRVLAPAGVLIAATNGRRHLRELDALVLARLPDAEPDDSADKFGLHSGADQLRPFFRQVTTLRHDDALAVRDAQAVVDYIASTPDGARLRDEQLAEIGREVSDEIRRSDRFVITKEVGAFVCWT